MTDQDPWLAIAIIARPHALRGGLILKPLTRTPEEMVDAPVEQVFLRRRGQIHGPFVMSHRAIHKGLPYVFFEGMDDREAVEPWIGSEVVIPESERWELEEGRYYFSDLEGLKMIDEVSREPLGTVVSVAEGSAHDYLVIPHPRNPARELMVPMIPMVVLQVDIPGGTVRVKLPEGLLDI